MIFMNSHDAYSSENTYTQTVKIPRAVCKRSELLSEDPKTKVQERERDDQYDQLSNCMHESNNYLIKMFIVWDEITCKMIKLLPEGNENKAHTQQWRVVQCKIENHRKQNLTYKRMVAVEVARKTTL